jgi:hypothetical protein
MGSSGSEEESDAATPKQVVQGKLAIKSQAEAKKAKKVEMKQKESESADDIKESWVRDEIIVLGSDAKKNIKGLYKQKIADMKLRRSVYPDRALSYYMEYPECTHSAYEKLNCQPVMLPPEESQRFTEMIEEDGNRVGVRLILPHRSSLIKLTPHSYIKRFSVPLAKVSKTYKAIKQLMKDNGFILSQRKKYNFCWGFSKYRKQVYVETK